MKNCRTYILLAITAVVLAWSERAASAQIIDVTPDVFQRARAIALAAREKEPTSPEAAIEGFAKAFHDEFGNTHGASAWIINKPEIAVHVTTPINAVFAELGMALKNLAPIPNKAPNAFVSIEITPRQVTAPDVRRVVVFVKDQEIKPIQSTLSPREFRNSFGAVFSKSAGEVTFPVDVFRQTVKIVLITDGDSIQWMNLPGIPGSLK